MTMKMFVLFILALFSISPGYAQTGFDNISVPGGVVRDTKTGMIAASKMTLGCNDEVYGRYDVCMDVYFHNLPKGHPDIFMKSNVNKKFTTTNKNILIRYIFVNELQTSLSFTRTIKLYDLEAQQFFNVDVDPGKKTYMVKSSTDGGQTWSVATKDVR
jgi:hypothetical protein